MTRSESLSPRDVVVLGAGPAGLSTAWYALRRGLSVEVVDRAPHVGGLASSLVVDGQSVDLGSHRLHPSIDAEVLDDLRSELGVDLRWRRRGGRIRMRGRWLTFPLQAGDLARHAPLGFVGGVGRDVVTGPFRRWGGRHVDRISFAAEVRAGLGPTVAASFYEPYAEKLWGVAADELAAELFRRRVSARSAAAIARRLVRRSAPAGFWYPTGGFGDICTSLSTHIAARGGTVTTGVVIDRVELDGDGATVRLRDGRALVATTVVSTIPAAGLAGALASDPAAVDAAAGLEFRGAALVYLSVPRPRYTAFDAHYFPESSTIVSRVSEPKNYRSSPADPTDRSVLCAEVPMTVGDELWACDDEQLADRVRRELVLQDLPDPTPRHVHVERRTHVYPVYRIGFEHRTAVLEASFDRHERLAVLGRQALFAHDNTHHALDMGKALVRALAADGSLDRERWQEARRAFADHVVED